MEESYGSFIEKVQLKAKLNPVNRQKLKSNQLRRKVRRQARSIEEVSSYSLQESHNSHQEDQSTFLLTHPAVARGMSVGEEQGLEQDQPS